MPVHGIDPSTRQRQPAAMPRMPIDDMTPPPRLLARMNAGDVTSEEIVRSLPRPRRASRAAQRLRPPRRRAVLDQARAVDRRRKAGEPLGPLAGVPVAIKDVLCVEGEPTTCGSRMLAELPARPTTPP